MTGSSKKTYRPSEFFRDLFGVVKGLPSLAGAVTHRRVGGALREKVMLAVTGVNECRYCAAIHSSLARKLNVSEEDIGRIMESGTGADPDNDDQPAIHFAAHYAQTNQHPDPDMVSMIRETYGPERAAELLHYMRMIYFANLTGNTFDALLGRLKAH
ncbi:MAG: carboxymuconolactone decarboxylase family protein [Deltaproteobacteria bacterium]|nr:carboxymuconolactone decarboxylase family protein [Deltaproteobacteria bacterium]